MAKTGKLPNREQILRRMWALANAGAQDAVRLACVGQEDWQGLDRLDLDALTEFKRGSNGVIELKFADRLEALDRLERLCREESGGGEDAFYQALSQGARGFYRKEGAHGNTEEGG